MAADDSLTVPETGGGDPSAIPPRLTLTPDQSPPRQPTPRQPIAEPAPEPDVQGAALVASQREPDRHAKVVDLATKLRMTPAFVEQNYDALATAEDRHTTADQMGSVSPTLKNWLSNPDNASIAKKEIASLSQIDTGAKLLTPPHPSEEEGGALDAIGTATATGMSDVALSAHLLAAAFGHTTPALAAADIAAAKQRSEALRADAPAYAKEYAQAIAEHEGDLTAARSAFMAGNGPSRKAGILNALVNFAQSAESNAPMDPAAARTLGETLSLIGAHVAGLNRIKGFAYQSLEGLASMAPMLAGTEIGAAGGAAVGSVVPVVGTAAGGFAGGIGGTFVGAAAVNIGSEIEAEFQRRGVNLSDPTAVEHALSDPQLMASVRSMATKAGLTSAAVMTLMNGFGGALGTRAAAAEGGAKVALKAGAVAAPAVGVAAGQEAGEAAAGRPVDPARAIATTLQMLAFGGATEAVGASRRAFLHPETAEAAAQATTDAQDAMRAQHDAQALSEVGRAVKDAPTTASVPDRLKDLIETATGGPDASTVYFQSDEWKQYWESKGTSPAEAAAIVMGDGGKAYTDAEATGSRLAIPLGDYLSTVGPTEHFEGLLDVARTRPDGLSFRDAQDVLQSLPATMKELADEATKQAAGEPTPLEQSAQQVRSDVEAQLTAAGVNPVAAKAQAHVYESAFRTLGARANISARELFNRYGLTIGRGPLEPTPEATTLMQSAKEAAARVPDGTVPSRESDAARVGSMADRPRTASGRLKDLSKARPDELANEYRALTEANAAVNATPEDIAARAQTMAKLEAEFKARGIEVPEAYMASYVGRTLAIGKLRAAQLETPGMPDLSSAMDREGRTLEQAARGKITFGDGHAFHIELLEKADRSTFLHETGHLYLEVLGDLAQSSDAAPDLKADYQTVRDWVGAEGDKPLTVEQHEQFARGFEAYLMEGKAPSVELRSAFARFKNWLVGVYQHLSALNVSLTPEVRQVFDRLLASDAQIKDAEAEANARPLFTDPRGAGMSEEQATRYQRAVNEAHEAAESEMTAQVMKQLRLEESKEWQAWREPIEQQVTREMQNRPVYQALSAMTKGTRPDGTPLAEGMPNPKLAKAALVGAYGKDVLNGMPRGTVTTDGGVHPDVVADLYGFSDGRALVDALRSAPKLDDAIKQETDARMQEQHGSRQTDADVRAQASAAVNGEGRAALLKREVEHLASDDFAAFAGLTKKLTRTVAPDAVIKQRAAEVIGSTKVRAVRPDLFEKAVARAGQDAVEKGMAGDWAGALAAKEQQRLALAVARAATDAKAQVDAGLDAFKKPFRSDARLEKTRDLSFINGARSLLAGLGIGSSDKGAASYLETVKTYAPDAYENVQAITDDVRALGVQDYRDLTMDQFTELRETVNQLWTLSRKAKQVVMDGKAEDLADVMAPILKNVVDRQSARTAARGIDKALGPIDKVANVALGLEASLRRVESFGRYMDGLETNGPTQRVIRQVLDATNAYRQHKTEVAEAIATMTEGLKGLPEQQDIKAPELGGYTFKDMKELLGAMLHTGNAEGPTSNLSKLLLGRGWGTLNEDGTLDRTKWDAFVQRMQQTNVLTKAHYDWLQGAGDIFEMLKPELQKAYYDVNARYMKEVEFTPIETPYGTYKGWYYPAIGDTKVAGGAEIENAMRASEDALLGTDSKFLLTQPASGMTKNRTGKTWPLVMDAGQFPRHVDAVLKYIHMAPTVREVFKVFNHRDFRDAMSGVNPSMVQDALIPFLRAASSQRSSAPETTTLGRAFANATNYVRQGAMQQVVGGNVVILAEQLLHLSAIQSMRTADNKAMVYYHDVASAMAKVIVSPSKLTDWIHDQSPTVATRDHTRLQKADAAYRAIMDPSALRTVQDLTAHSVNFVGHLMNGLMDKSVWLGAYDRAQQRGIAGDAAKQYADAVVRQGLGGHNPEDIAEVQRGTALTKAMLGMYGFFNAKANQLGTDAFAQTMTDAGLQRSKTRMAAVYVMGLLAMSASGAAARDLIGGQRKKQDEPWTDVLAEWAGWGQLEAVGRMIPGGAVPLQTAEMFFHKKGASADNLLSSPAANFLTNIVGTGRAAGRVVRDEPVTSKDVKDVLGLFGTLFHVPAKVLARPIGYQMDVNAGKAHPSGAADEVRGLLTGTGSR